MLRACTSVFESESKSIKTLTGCSLRTKNSMTAIPQVLRSSTFKALTCSQWTSFCGNNADKLVWLTPLNYSMCGETYVSFYFIKF